MTYRFSSAAGLLAGHLAVPRAAPGAGGIPGVVVCHGFPAGAGGAATSARTYPELADRIANELGMVALAFTFRGAGESEGSFSLRGWQDDLLAAVDHVLAGAGVNGVRVVGFGTGGALALCAAVEDERIGGVAALGAPADFDDWAIQPRRLLDHARHIRLIKDPDYPADFDEWARQLRDIRAVACAPALHPRSLLVVHGTEDEVVPDFEARVLGDAHGAADLRLIAGAGHRLRHDPRAVAVLLGWLDRERHRRRAVRQASAP
jgi:putative redox protein